MYVKVNNQVVEKYPYTIGNLRKDNKNIGFPKIITTEMLRAYGVYEVIKTDKPSFNEATQYVIESDPSYIGGNWTQQWSIVDRTDEQIVEYRNFKNDIMRSLRNDFLAKSDWTQLPDTSVDREAWATYRQALRDLPNDQNWPFVDFPTPPNN